MKNKLLIILIISLVFLSIACKKTETSNDLPSEGEQIETDVYKLIDDIASNFKKHEFAYSICTGVTISTGLIKITQYSYTLEINDYSKESYFFKEAISKSGVKKTGERRLFRKDDVLIDEVSKVEASSEGITSYTYKNNPYTISYDDYADTYGSTEVEFLAFIMNEETILSSSVVYSSDKYYITLELEPNKSTVNYKKEVGHMAGSNKLEYEKIKLVIVTSSEKEVIEVTISEDFYMAVPIIGNFNLHNDMIKRFYYESNSDYYIEKFYF